MRHRARKLPALVVATVVAGLLAVPGTVQAQQTLNIQTGLPFENGAPGEGNRFYAPELNVHSGDTLSFANTGFHTATLLPTSVADVDQWRQDNQVGFDKPFSLFLTDPDDTALDPGASAQKPARKFNNAVAFPNPPTCGAEGQPPCDYAGDTLLNSGLFGTWSATINSAPNTSAWALCLVHPTMEFKINVVPSGQPTSTQAEIDSYLETQGGADADAALDKHKKLSKKHVKKNGKWQAWVGFDGEGYALIAMYPRRLEIKKGARVQFNFELLSEVHTATIPKDKAKKIFRGDFLPACDPDGDAGPGPDTPPDTQEPPFCNDPLQLELDISSKTVSTYGDGKFKGGDYENSGLKGPMVGDTGSYTLKFTKKSDSKGYKYMCMIHGPFQTGIVEVGS